MVIVARCHYPPLPTRGLWRETIRQPACTNEFARHLGDVMVRDTRGYYHCADRGVLATRVII